MPEAGLLTRTTGNFSFSQSQQPPTCWSLDSEQLPGRIMKRRQGRGLCPLMLFTQDTAPASSIPFYTEPSDTPEPRLAVPSHLPAPLGTPERPGHRHGAHPPTLTVIGIRTLHKVRTPGPTSPSYWKETETRTEITCLKIAQLIFLGPFCLVTFCDVPQVICIYIHIFIYSLQFVKTQNYIPKRVYFTVYKVYYIACHFIFPILTHRYTMLY